MPGSTAFRAAAAGGAVKEVLSGAAGARPTLARRPMLVSVPSTSSPPPPPPSPPSSFSFGPAPSKEEAEQAVSNLRRVFGPATYSKFYGDEPEIGSSNAEEQLRWSNPIRSSGQERVFDAFRLLQLNPSVQKMVVSISSDKAVWDAVMKNEAVQELQKSFHAARSKSLSSHGQSDDITASILRWILENTKAKIIEFIDKIINLVNELLHSHEKEKDLDIFGDIVRSSFMLSVLVYIIVIIARIR